MEGSLSAIPSQSYNSDFKINTLVATLPDAMCYRVLCRYTVSVKGACGKFDLQLLS